MKGAINIVSGLKGDEKLTAARQLLTVAMTSTLGSMVAAPLLKQWTGNENAQSGGFGYDTLADVGKDVYDASQGKGVGRSLGQAAQSLASPGYAMQAVDLVRGLNPYFGKPIAQAGETPTEIMKEYGSELADKLSPVQRAIGMSQGRLTPKELAYQQAFGTKYPKPLPKTVTNDIKMRRHYGTPLDSLSREISDYIKGTTQ